MKVLVLPAAFVAVAMLVSTPAFGQATKKDCPPQPSASPGSPARTQPAPQKIEGQVTQVDPKAGTMTVRRPDGTTHEFRGSTETVKDYKAGDKIELTLREDPC